jgi:peptide/nickel transport system permease protein
VFFIPTLFFVSLIAFGLSKVAPGDPVEIYSKSSSENSRDVANSDRVYQQTAAFLGLDKPTFYFSLSSAAYPDTLYRIVQQPQREAARKLIAQYGNWDAISRYRLHIQSFERFLNLDLQHTDQYQALSIVRGNVHELYTQYKHNEIEAILKDLQNRIHKDSLLNLAASDRLERMADSYVQVRQHITRSKLYLPDFKWYGFDNQYHHWMSKFLRGNFGVAYTDGRPVADKINDALFWTLMMNGIAILLAYLLSIPLGIFSAVRKDTWQDQLITISLFVLHSLPVFWIATLLLIFFTTPEYGMYIFPNASNGMGALPRTAPFWNRFLEAAAHLILPVFCLTYGSLAFISRQMRGGMLDVLQQDYIRTARAKGLGERAVIWHHAFRNALFPIITLFASVFPAALAGSVVIERIFNIPGMGNLTVQAINQRDWPIVYTVLMFSAILTMIGILIADVLYAVLDPRISYSNRKK